MKTIVQRLAKFLEGMNYCLGEGDTTYEDMAQYLIDEDPELWEHNFDFDSLNTIHSIMYSTVESSDPEINSSDKMQQLIKDAIEMYCDENLLMVNIETFKDAQILVNNKGLVVQMGGGHRYQIEIKKY